MEWLRRIQRSESFEELRARMIAETSAYITDGLRHPELVVRIPMIESGQGRFPPSFAEAFWEPVLFE